MYYFNKNIYYQHCRLSIISGIMPIIFAICFIWMPETPQYLLMRGKVNQAEKSLQYFRGKNFNIKTELAKMKDDVDQQKKNKACENHFD